MKISYNKLAGMIGAAAVGVLVGMLLAPKKGKDLRASILGAALDGVGKKDEAASETDSQSIHEKAHLN